MPGMEHADNKTQICLPPPTTVPTEVLKIDANTPDSHVPRDPRLVRLTGAHPLNVEAPLRTLFDEGFLTSPEMFYVRNHGAVPIVKYEDILSWTFSVEGLVANPFSITVSQLMNEFDQVTLPITLVCAGNRRKEQNVVRKTKGFSWGSAGVSTALFTGVLMAEVLKRAKPTRTAKYICMEGGDKLPNGCYATSVKLSWAMNPDRAIMLSYKMNGEMLREDHGKPLRVVVPGQIGGRSVKWLRRIIVTDAPSENWYHIYDNRVLPTMVSTEESATTPKWWQDERYAIYDLSPNSAICRPGHDERVPLGGDYEVRGYAYSGGGRRVTRIEISLTKGRHWRLAEIDYAEDRYRDVEAELYGGRLDMSSRDTSYCWCFWRLEVSTDDLATCEDILVRAMDESMCIQPRDMYWSVLGMMNNPWFRVVVTKDGDSLRFEHPTQPGTLSGGWMERVQSTGGDLLDGFWGEGRREEKLAVEDEPAMAKKEMTKFISMQELRQHKTPEEPWFVINGEVYNGAEFLDDHPGGPESITTVAGADATEEFLAIHSWTAKQMLADFHIGTLQSSAESSPESSPETPIEYTRGLTLPVDTSTISKNLNGLVSRFWRS